MNIISRLKTLDGFKGGISPRLSYRNICIVSGLEILMVFILSGCQGLFYYYDSYTFLGLLDNLLNFIPDNLRTPIYPLFFDGLRKIAGETAGNILTVLIQVALFYISLAILREICKEIKLNEKITFWLIAFYAIWPPMPTFTCLFMTESLAAFSFVLQLYLVLRVLRHPSIKLAAAIGLLSIFMVFLRPAFLYILGILAIGWVIIWIMSPRSSRICITGICFCLIAGAVVFGYSSLIKNYYGFRAISAVSDINNYFLLREAKALDPSSTDDETVKDMFISFQQEEKEFGADMSDYIKGWREVPTITDIIGYAEFHEVISANIKSHPKEISIALAKRIKNSSSVPFFYAYKSEVNPFYVLVYMININFGIYYLFMLIMLIIIIRQFRRSRQMPVYTLFLWASSAGLAFVSIIGAMNDWARLMVPAESAFLLLAALAFRKIKLQKTDAILP